MKSTFLYFAYGSNLLTERIRLNNPTAVKRAVAKLQGYKLDFEVIGQRWHGAVATIIPAPDRCVWGVVWELHNSDLENLNRQERGYDPIEVNVFGEDGSSYKCCTYQLAKTPGSDDKPSIVYKNVIVNGAIENGLPKIYIDELRKIEDNGYNGPVDVKLSFRG